MREFIVDKAGQPVTDTDGKLVDKFLAIEKEVTIEKGELTLFALLEREDGLNKWDVVISAPWFGENKREVLDFIAGKINEKLDLQERLMLSRVVLLNTGAGAVKAINQAFYTKHNPVELVNVTVFGMHVNHAWIITSNGDVDTQSV